MTDAGLAVRLSFPKGEHRDVIVQPGEITLGAAPDNTVVLSKEGILPHHASIVVDQRGFTLMVRSGEAGAHVNARPVREKAILRLGDVVSLRSVNLVLKPDSDESIRSQVPPRVEGNASMSNSDGSDTRNRQVPPRVVLRGVSGPHFGKIVPIYGRLTIGRDSDCDLVLDEMEMSRKHALIEVSANEIFLRDLGSANGTFVNGVQVHDASLFSGDQIAFDRNRFLIEAPGMPVRKAEPRPAQPVTPEPKAQVEVTQTLRAIRPQPAATPASAPAAPAQPAPRRTGTAPAPSAAPAGTSWSPWLLIGAAALIAVAIAWLLLGSR